MKTTETKETTEEIKVIDVPLSNMEIVPQSKFEILPVSQYDRLIELAINKDADIDKLEKLMMLKEKHEENEARKAFHVAMSNFKKNPPEITKDKKVEYKQVSYTHASLHNVTNTINMALSEHGLTAAWFMGQDQGRVKVTCVITHELGHREKTSLEATADNSGSKNGIQAIASTVTYLQRYTILALTGLATKDMDNDGRTSEPVQYIDDKQLSQLTDMLLAIDKTEAEYCIFKNVKSLKEITVNMFSACVAELKPQE